MSRPKFVVPKLNAQDSTKPKFLVPKLSFSTKNGLSSLRLKKLTDNESPEYSSLSDLVSDHLSAFKVKTSECSFKKEPRLTESLDSVAEKVSNLKINDENKSVIEDKWHIDLTVALRESKSAPSVSRNSEKPEEQFEVPFIDCEIEPRETVENVAECRLNISDILNCHSPLSKKVSKFGRILCMKYRRKRLHDIKFVDPYKRKTFKFKFDTPSKDDLILSHLGRKM